METIYSYYVTETYNFPIKYGVVALKQCENGGWIDAGRRGDFDSIEEARKLIPPHYVRAVPTKFQNRVVEYWDHPSSPRAGKA